MIRPEDRFTKNPEIIHRRMKDEFVLLPIHPKKETTRPFYFFEEVGGRIWELLDGDRACRKIVEEIALEFGVREVRIEGEVFAFLNDLEKEDLIRRLP